MPLPPLAPVGDLPPGVHRCSGRELLERFAAGSVRRQVVGLRLKRVLEVIASLDTVAKVVVFGSFVSDKPNPNDVDLFLVMDDTFDLGAVTGEARLVFDHAAAQAHFGASVFWATRSGCFPSEEEMVSGWSIKRDGTARGIVEITKEPS